MLYMRKNRFLFIFIILLLVVAVGGLFACKRVEETTGDVNGDVIGVSTGMGTVYGALLAADGSKDQTVYFLSVEGGYRDGDKTYDVALSAEIDVTQANIENDARSRLALEVKSGTTEILALYYSEGDLYINCMPYVSRGKISDFALAERLAELNREKNSGAVKSVVDLIPTVASRIFDGCKYYYKEETKESRYVFSLSYARLFASLGELVDSADIGISSVELLAALHVSDALTASLSSGESEATVEFRLSDGAFVSAKAEDAGKAFELRSFTLSRDSLPVTISSAVSEFTEWDARNIYVKSGKAQLAFSREEGDVSLDRFGIAANLLFVELTHPFDYTLTTHYVAGSGLEGSLVILDKNDKTTSFVLKDGYLYVDLTAYGLAKCKIAKSELESRLGVFDLTDTDTYTFKDKLRLASLLAAGTTKSGDRVSCSFGKDVFELLSEKIGFHGLFGITGGTLSWSVADNVLSDVSASVSLPGMTLTLKNEYEAFSFGTPRDVALPEDAAAYVDLAANTSTHVSLAGKVSQQTPFSNAGAILSSLLSSMSGEALAFTAEGNELNYTADLLYGAAGALDRAIIEFDSSKGAEVVRLYYTSEDATHFYLILPPDGTVRSIRKMTLAEAPFAAFNRAMDLERSEQAGKIYLAATDDYFSFGASATLASEALEVLGRIHTGLTARWIDEMAFRRVEFRIYADKMEGRLIFDSKSSLIVTATTFSVTHNDAFDIETVEPENTPTEVSLFADNAMPAKARVTFSENVNVQPLNVSMDGLWTYVESQVPTSARNDHATVAASASVLAKVVTRSLTVDCSAPISAKLTAVTDELGVYDTNTKTFTFARYGEKKVQTVLAKFDQVTLADAYTKDIVSWTIPATIEQEVMTIQPKVKTYFGNDVAIGVDFKLHFTGATATSCDEVVLFEAYDGRDPFNTDDPETYPRTITVLTEKGDPITVTVDKWDATGALTVKDYAERNQLYSCSVTDTVKAKIKDCLGNTDPVDVSIRLKAKTLPSEDADIDFDMTGRVGATYDKVNKKFIFDVLYVQSLSSVGWDRVLPSTMLLDGKPFFSGIGWSFTEVTAVPNAEGAAGEVTLRVGDNVSGFQTRVYPYEFTAITVTGTALLDEAGATIAEKTSEMYAYVFDDVNVFTYRYPTYILVTYNKGEEEGLTTRLAADWSFENGFKESDLVNGGTYVGTSRVGSEPITVSFTFKRAHAYGCDFVTEGGKISVPAYVAPDGTAVSGGDLSYAENNGEKRLIFSVRDAMSNVLRYYDEKSYPSTIRIYLSEDKSEYADVSVDSWDLSAYKKKTDIVTAGFLTQNDSKEKRIIAVVRGQNIPVATYVAPAIGMSDEVYTDDTIAEKKTVKFYLLTADGDKNYKVNDPRKAETYPKKLYVKKSGELSRDKTIDIVRWEGYDAFSTLFETELAKGTPVQNISGGYLCTAVIGDDNVGYGEIKIEVVLEATVLENLDVAGILAAVSSEVAATEDGSAVKRIEGAGTRSGSKETFSYAFSLEMNPYYVSPDSQQSYPRYLTFELNGLPVRTTAKWDISKVDPLATKLGNTYKYNPTDDPVGFPVYAELELGDDLPNVKIGVEVNIKSREIAYVWIDGSSQPYIYVDCYAQEPFGKNVYGNEAHLKVEVQFVGDLHKYPLDLRYDISDISLSYDGSGRKSEATHKDFRVYVGNESGGYQPIAGYEVHVMAKRVASIGIVNGGVTPFYEKVTALDGTFEEYFHHVDDLVTIVDGVPQMPTELEISFTDGSAPVRVREYKSAAAGEGLVFEWIRDEYSRLGVRLWNSNLSVAVRGADQELFNREHTADQTPVTPGVVFKVDSYTLAYGDTLETYLTPARVIDAFVDNFKLGAVEEKYQNRYITVKGETEPIAMNETLHAGAYSLCVNVDGHGLYKGTAMIDFTVAPKNIEDEVVVLVDGTVNKNALSKGLDYNKTRGYVITATSGSYGVSVTMSVNDAESVLLRDVNYRNVAPYDVIPYVIVVRSVDPDYAVGENNAGKEYTITLHELGLTDSEIVVSGVKWNAVKTDFDYTVYSAVGVEELDRFYTTENLTHGYVVTYYSDEDHEVEYTEALVSGTTYYYIITVKIENYSKALKTGSVTVPA